MPHSSHWLVSKVIKENVPPRVSLVKYLDDGGVYRVEILGTEYAVTALILTVINRVGTLDVLPLMTPTKRHCANVNGRVSAVLGNLHFDW